MDTISLVDSKRSNNYEATRYSRSDNCYEATSNSLSKNEDQINANGLDKEVVEKLNPEEFSVQEAIDHIGFGWFQIKLSVISGLTWMADSMEIMLLSILGPVLSCQWDLQPWKQALLTTLVMVGMATGSSFWGKMSDKHGRKTALALASSLIGYFGFLSAFSPMYLWMAICRFLVGCCLAALPQTVTLYSEYLPTQSRAASLIALEAFFAVGAAVEVIMALIIMPRLGWRYLMAFSALPVLFFPILSPWLPESARFLLTCGRHKEAVAMLDRIARDNGKTLPRGKLSTLVIENISRGRIRDMYQPSTRRLSVLLNILWFLLGFSYYGMALLLPTLLNKPDGCHGNDVKVATKETCSVSCKPFTEEDYMELTVTSFADAPGLLISYLLQLVMQRRHCISLITTVFSIFLFLSNICLNRSTLTALMFVSRSMISGAHQIAFVYTTECFPTSIRALGLGTNSGLARMGAIVTPYVAQVGTEWSAFFSFTFYGVVGLLAALFSILLPFDTKGRAMVDISH
ncbi:hypothetical protein RRG08_026052 [Elysia crispata]|uniref:Major facilitator superfamily (MFS) profile domain-containing protein n=1 Tax=Elysia crispata TaxID=231223 RepID=A0AAE0YYM9_9GAST|nr:hypothetical protein RRG08_026052 [Elysia crispata]